MQPKVVLIDRYNVTGDCEIEAQIIEDAGIAFVMEDCHTDDEIITAAKDADVILDVFTPLNKTVISQLPKCKGIVRYGIGVDNVDLSEASRKGIPVCNIPDYCIPEVATHTIGMILSLARKIPMYDHLVKQGQWNKAYGYPMHRLSNQILGLLGFGNIAREVAKYATPFGFKIITFDPFVSNDICDTYGVERVALDTLFSTSDVISLHMPLNESTKHIINKESFALMKSTVLLVNAARGALIRHEDLIEAITQNKIRGAALDVLENEPVARDDEILRFENIIITPHVAFRSQESIVEQRQKIAQTACHLIRGELVPNVVNQARH